MGDARAHESGPEAPARAAAEAWERVGSARSVVIVEGISDRVAVEAAAEVRGIDLTDHAVVVLPIGGAQAIGNTLVELRRRAASASIGGLYDVAEEPFFVRALANTDRSDRADRELLEGLGFFACVEDLEDELIRAAGHELATAVIDDEGDRSSFRTMQRQPAWREQPFPAQFRRFIGAGSRRKHRYGSALVRAIGDDRLPRPLVAVIDHVTG